MSESIHEQLSSPPAASSITLSAVQHILTLYDTVLDTYYVEKVKDSKKRKAAIDTDKWRYETLPEEVARWNDSEGLSQAQLERLVEWKITHGKFRPFLLPQVRKNEPQVVKGQTNKSRKHLLHNDTATEPGSIPPNDIIKKALDIACVLNGVGPATGTLLLSVFMPDRIPFFQDELYAWLVSAQENSLNATKLKYNAKEYFDLVDGVRQLRSRLGGHHKLRAWEIEKLGFVIGHWDMLSQGDRKEIWTLTGADGSIENSADTMHITTKKRKTGNSHEQDVKKISDRKTGNAQNQSMGSIDATPSHGESETEALSKPASHRRSKRTKR